MRITRIDHWRVAVPYPAPFHPSWIPGFTQTENRFDLICLTTAAGLQGFAAAPCMGGERAGLGSLLGPYLLGERADDIASVRQRIREMSYLGWRVGWLEAACWDIVGKSRNLPLYQLLGGAPGGSVATYASTGEVRTGAYRVEEIEARAKEGFTGIKLRVHAPTLQEDLEQIRVARRAMGEGLQLGIDANQAWRVAAIGDAPLWDYERAYAFCKEAESLGYTWVEEPLPLDDYAGQARLRAATEINISGGELNSGGLPELRMMIEKGCYDWYQPDAVFCGGVSETWAIIKEIERRGAIYSPHTWTNGIGFAINLQLFAASPWRDQKLLEYPYDPPGFVPEGRDALLVEPWLHQRGRLELPTRPGLGFEIDLRQLRRYGTKVFTSTKVRVAVAAVRERGLAAARSLGAVRDGRLAARRAQLEREGADPALSALHALAETSQ